MTLEECYQILNLPLGASVEDIDFALGKQRTELVRQGRKKDIAQLTAAYHQLRDHTLEQNAVAPAELDVYLPTQYIRDQLDRLLQPQKIRATVQILEKERQLEVQLQGRSGIVQPLVAVPVMKCLQALELVGIETVTIYGMRGQNAVGWQQKFQIDESIQAADTDPYSFNNRYVNRAAFPIAFLIAIVAQLLVFPRFLLRGVQIWIHEFGHATVAWLSGRGATPLPLGWTNVNEDRSTTVYLCFLILLLLLFWSGWREKKRWAMVLAVVLAISQFYMTWVMSEYAYFTWLAFGGVGGELYLSTFLMVCFYFPLPEKFRWDFWRYFVLLMAAYTFTASFGMWHQIKVGAAEIPWGSMLGGQGDAGGDMNKLSSANWSDVQIIHTYSHLSNACLLVLIGIYVVFFLKSIQHQSWRQLRK
jgi:hypothetical protein